MKAKGYDVQDMPRDAKALMETVINDPEALQGSPELSIAHRMSVEEYERLTPYSERLEENWGKPPGNLNSDGQNLLIYGRHFGNIFVGYNQRLVMKAIPCAFSIPAAQVPTMDLRPITPI